MRLLKNITVVLTGCLIGFLFRGSPETQYIEDCIVAEQELLPVEEDYPEQYHFSDAAIMPFQATTRPGSNVKIPVRPHFSDCTFQNFIKNQWHRFSIRKGNMVKTFLKLIAYDVNSSHYYFPCRYHVLALREIII